MSEVTPRTRGLSAALVLSLSLALVLGLVPPKAQAATRVRGEMLELTNRSRASHQRGALELSPRLSRLALRHSRAMARQGRLFHTRNVPRELRSVHWTAWGENVGFTTESLATLQRMFMRSPEHRSNIVNRRFTMVGIGIVRSGGRFWVTLDFYG